MEPRFTISEVCSTSWQRAKAQIWVLAGLIISMIIISFTLSMVAMPFQESTTGTIIVNLISIVFSCFFSLGYIKNIFQALDDDEPQFSAYGQQAHKIGTYFVSNLLVSIITIIGLCLLIIPGIYLALRLQFYSAFIVEENAGIIESMKRSWEITRGQVMPLFLVALVMIGFILLGCAIFGIGVFVAIPLVYIMYAYVFRKLNNPLEIIEY